MQFDSVKLMTYMQARRQDLAKKADRHEISRSTHQHQVTCAEAEVTREEDRRNPLQHSSSPYDDTPGQQCRRRFRLFVPISTRYSAAPRSARPAVNGHNGSAAIN